MATPPTPPDPAAEESVLDLLREKLELEEKSKEGLEALITAQDEYQKRIEKLSRSKEKNLLLAESEVEKATLYTRLQRQMIANEEDVTDAMVEQLKIYEDLEKKTKKNLENIKGTSKRIKEGTDAAAQFGMTFAKSLSQYEKHPFFNSQNLINVGKALMGGRKAAGAFIGALGVSIVTNFIDSMIGLVFEMNRAETAMRKATGAAEGFTKRMRGVYDSVRVNTVTMKEFYDQVTSLRSGFTDFTMLAGGTQERIAEVTSTMVRLGHSGEDLTKGLQTATVAFQMTGDEALNTMMDLDAFARDMGIPPKQLTAQYGRMGGSLSKLGDEGTRAFKDLARVSKITGIEMDKIINITDKFDTFEDAAERTGMLNAALGGNFMNAMDMMMETDPIGRFQMIKESIEATGLSFNDMGYFQKKFYAEAAGLEDVSQLAAIMRGDFDALDENMGKTEADYARMAEEAKKMSNFQERFNAIMMKLIPILEPVLEYIDDLLTYYEQNEAALTDVEGPLYVFIDALQTLGNVMMFVIRNFEWFVGIWIVGLISKIPILAGLLNGLGMRIAMIGATSGGAIAPTAGLAGALSALRAGPILAMGAALGFAALGIAAIAYQISQMDQTQLEYFLYFMLSLIPVVPAVALAFAAAIVKIAAAGTVAAPVSPIIFALGAAFLAMGGAVALAGYGVQMASDSFGQLANVFTWESVLVFGAFLAILLVAAKFAPIVATGFSVLGLSMLGFILTLYLIPVEHLNALTSWVEKLNKVEYGNIAKVATAIRDVASAMHDIPFFKALTLNATLETAGVVAEAVRQLGGPTPTGPQGANTGGAGQTSREIAKLPITVVIGGEQFAAQVVRVMETADGVRAIESVNGQ